jgi:hypothetical protein
MNTLSENLQTDEMDGLPEVDTFSTTLEPINRTEKPLFTLKDRICCVSLMATFFALMRFFLSK